MLLDAQLILVPTAFPLSLVAAAGVSVPSPVIDLLGQGVGTAPFNIIGNVALFGTDFGIGKQQLELMINTGIAFATSNSATLNVQFQLAVDQGAAGAYQPGTWNTVIETGTIAPSTTLLIANQTIFRADWPPAFPAGLRPRYMRLNFSIPAATNFTAGTIGFAGVVLCRDDQQNRFAAANYAVH